MRARYLLAPAVVLLLAACSGGGPAPAVEPPATASVTAAEETTAEAPETFQEMLDRVGIEPDNVTSYEEYATECLCESEMTALGPGFGNEVRFWGIDNPDAGRSPDLVRHVISENCPDRTGGAEEILETLD